MTKEGSSHFTVQDLPNGGPFIAGSGAGGNDDWKKYKKVSIDPTSSERDPRDDYRTLVSAIVPRPIALILTLSKDGTLSNLAPFSYFGLSNADPPIFTVGITSATLNKDTARNLLETEECTINIISEWFVEAANATCVNSPYGVSEWEITGLTKADSEVVKPPHVLESAFSIEAKVVAVHEWKSRRNPDKVTGRTFIFEGVRFHAREDVINEQLNGLDVGKLKPVSRLGGNTYGKTTEGFDISRPEYKDLCKDLETN